MTSLLVLSPEARHINGAKQYRPYNNQTLDEILDEVAKKAIQGNPQFERFEIFSNYFVGIDIATLSKVICCKIQDDVAIAFVDWAIFKLKDELPSAVYILGLFSNYPDLKFMFLKGTDGYKTFLVTNGASINTEPEFIALLTLFQQDRRTMRVLEEMVKKRKGDS